ncbi:hypothetical protein RN001_008964 [Aquatica leii]|uniref:DUF4371 domain-containing protein n=1 Tax=Aquatica leii TaxID=1421715 RepID=A0AAN7QJC5_9COLE|nr:hypothetical protein RN001_008964 [Aquatica leii]
MIETKRNGEEENTTPTPNNTEPNDTFDSNFKIFSNKQGSSSLFDIGDFINFSTISNLSDLQKYTLRTNVPNPDKKFESFSQYSWLIYSKKLQGAFGNLVHEEFLGFVLLNQLNAQSEILSFCEKANLNMEKLVGLGFDGCATMAGVGGGVHKIIRDKHPKALFFRCASHKLNLVVNHVNSVRKIQNAVGIIKEVLKFLCDSTL